MAVARRGGIFSKHALMLGRTQYDPPSVKMLLFTLVSLFLISFFCVFSCFAVFTVLSLALSDLWGCVARAVVMHQLASVCSTILWYHSVSLMLSCLLLHSIHPATFTKLYSVAPHVHGDTRSSVITFSVLPCPQGTFIFTQLNSCSWECLSVSVCKLQSCF